MRLFDRNEEISILKATVENYVVACKQKNEEIEQLTHENISLREEIEMLKAAFRRFKNEEARMAVIEFLRTVDIKKTKPRIIFSDPGSSGEVVPGTVKKYE